MFFSCFYLHPPQLERPEGCLQPLNTVSNCSSCSQLKSPQHKAAWHEPRREHQLERNQKALMEKRLGTGSGEADIGDKARRRRGATWAGAAPARRSQVGADTSRVSSGWMQVAEPWGVGGHKGLTEGQTSPSCALGRGVCHLGNWTVAGEAQSRRKAQECRRQSLFPGRSCPRMGTQEKRGHPDAGSGGLTGALA